MTSRVGARIVKVWAVLLALTALLAPASPAFASIAFVQDLGQAADVGSSVTITTAGAVTAGHSIIVFVATSNTATTITCSDPVNGAYTTDVQTTTTNARAAICSRHNVQSLPAGTNITISSTLLTDFAARAAELSGLAATGTLDRTAEARGSNLAASVTLGAATTQADELLVAAFDRTNITGGRGFTAGTNGVGSCVGSGTYSALPRVQQSFTLVYPEYCIVAATGTYSATGTFEGSDPWSAVMATYKADVTAPAVTTSGGSLGYTENAAPQAIDPGLSVTDADSASLTGATVSITGNFVAAEDVLAFTNTATITGSLNVAGDTLTLSGTDSVTDYQAALRSVTYANSSDAPSTATRTVSFQVTDAGSNASNTATGTVTITSVNDAPAGNNKTVSTNEDTAYTFATADFGFGDVDGNALLAVKITTVPGAGSLTDNSVAVTAGQFVPVADITGGLLRFAPATNANGASYASFTFQVQDNGGTANGGVDLDATARTMTIDVTAANDAPVFALGGNPPAVNEDAGPVTVPGFATGIAPGPATATDEAGQTLTFNVQVTGTTGSLAFTTPPAINPTIGNLTYQSSPNTNGTATVSVTLSDNGSNVAPNVNTSGAQTFTITVNAVNDAPDGADDQYSVLANVATTIAAPGVLANDADVDGPTLTAMLVTNARYGTVVLRPDGGFTYTPSAGFTGPDSFAYKPNDSVADGVPVTVRLSVGGSALSIDDARTEEGNAGTKSLTFTVTLAPASSSQVTVQVQTQDGTATAGSDYVALPPTTLTFAPGETSKPVSVTVNGDTAVEADETFSVVLSNPTAASIARGTGTGRILNDDSASPKAQTVRVTSGGTPVPGRLQVTITADTSSCSANNTLQRIDFGAARDARVEVPGAAPGTPGGPSVTPGQPDGTPGNFTLPVNAPSVTFFLQRQAPGAFQVDLAIVDTCNASGVPFRTFVGAGIGVR